MTLRNGHILNIFPSKSSIDREIYDNLISIIYLQLD
jgi:hypothetical protein